ncbi:hypothetical protein FRUB_04831 [Fimbriiglobus ruber]|uniref:SMI1/KNR4 family protein n=1 Tax=Fimbriiglobus ruber TaxID=1908690 RepID=A0A225DUW7_9BACT|nr:hypothetical protein FRUB_04831 [Fimbriiglobus ruber]
MEYTEGTLSETDRQAVHDAAVQAYQQLKAAGDESAQVAGGIWDLLNPMDDDYFRKRAWGMRLFRDHGPIRSEPLYCQLMRCVFGNPFRPVTFSPSWLSSTTAALARQMYDSRDFSTMPILADALQDAGCDNADVLSHCRGGGPHVRGCWVVDRVLGKE